MSQLMDIANTIINAGLLLFIITYFKEQSGINQRLLTIAEHHEKRLDKIDSRIKGLEGACKYNG